MARVFVVLFTFFSALNSYANQGCYRGVYAQGVLPRFIIPISAAGGSALAFVPDSDLLNVVTMDGRMEMYRLEDRKRVGTGRIHFPGSVPDISSYHITNEETSRTVTHHFLLRESGAYTASVADAYRRKMWDPISITSQPLPGPDFPCQWSSIENLMLRAGVAGKMNLYDYQDITSIRRLLTFVPSEFADPMSENKIRGVSFSQTHVASVTHDNRVRVWRRDSPDKEIFDEWIEGALEVAISKNRLYVGKFAGDVSIFSFGSSDPIEELSFEGANKQTQPELLLSDDGRKLAVKNWDSTDIYQVTSKGHTWIANYPTDHHRDLIKFSPDGDRLTSYALSLKAIAVWDLPEVSD